MAHIKICPECSTEYFAHIETCADCGAVLLTPEELKKVEEEKKRCMEKIIKDPVAVREGDLPWIDQLYDILIDAGISCMVTADTGCKKGCCGHPYQLLVSSGDAEAASARIEDHFRNIHPELESSQNMLSQGNCPACTSPVEPGALECPDCGLTLLIIEQKDGGDR